MALRRRLLISLKDFLEAKAAANPYWMQIKLKHMLRTDEQLKTLRIPLNDKLSLRILCSVPTDKPPDGLQEKPIVLSAKDGSPINQETIVKVVPKKKKQLDTSAIYTRNVFITPLRAMREYLLVPKDLEDLWRTKRRSPYENSPPITVYLRSEVENKAIEKYGSLDDLEKERVKARRQEELYSRGLSPIKPLNYGETELPTKDIHLERQRKTIFKSGSGKVVLSAVAINGMNAILKFFAWIYTGSHAMFAEAVHSLADTLNQCILAYGIHQSLKNPNTSHPYGYSNFRYVSSLISGVGIFCVGAGFSWYHGVEGLLHPKEITDLYWAIAVLGGSLVSESATLMMAINNISRKSKQAKTTFMEYVKRGQDPSVNVVLMEDLAAVTGVVVAAGCMWLSHSTGSHVPDAVGSIMIGSLLAGVSAFIIQTNSNALLGRSIPEQNQRELQTALESDMMIRSVQDIKATDMGSNMIRFKAEVDIDGRMLTKKYLNEQSLTQLLREMKHCETADDVEQFMTMHGEKIVDLIGGEIDRIEKILKSVNPSVRHVDLEVL